MAVWEYPCIMLQCCLRVQLCTGIFTHMCCWKHAQHEWILIEWRATGKRQAGRQACMHACMVMSVCVHCAGGHSMAQGDAEAGG